MARRKTGSRKTAGKTRKRRSSAARRMPARKAKAGKAAARKTKGVRAKKAGRAKAAAKRPAKKTGGKTRARKEIFGEGNYTATRNFDRAEKAFVKRNRSRIPELGKEAEKALEGPEGPQLQEAEQEAAAPGREDEAA